MDTFTKLFGSLVSFVDHCFDRIVIFSGCAKNAVLRRETLSGPGPSPAFLVRL